MNKLKCSKCGLVNPVGELACRRCGGILGLRVRKSLTEQQTKSPRYLFLLPFLLVALALGVWYRQIKKSATDSIHLDKEEWHELTMDSKVSPKGQPVASKPYDPLKGFDLKGEELRKQLEPIKVPVFEPPPPAKQP